MLEGDIEYSAMGEYVGGRVMWPDGTAGDYAVTDYEDVPTVGDHLLCGYTVTYEPIGRPKRTVVQPRWARDPASAVVKVRPGLIVS